MTSVTGLGHMFLGTETADYPLDACVMLTLDPTTAQGRFDFESVRTTFDSRVRGTVLTQRLRRVAPLGPSYVAASWETDPAFAIDRHLRRARIAGAGDRDALVALALELSAGPLPRDRPLWGAWYVEGMADGRVGLIIRVHHAIVDGMAGVALFGAVFDLEPDPVAGRARLTDLDAPGRLALVARALPALVAAPMTAARRTVDLGLALRAGRRAGKNASRGRLFRDSASGCRFNGPVRDPAPAVALLELPLDEVKAVKRSLGTTVNDVVLALVTGGLRTYLEHHGDPLDGPLAAMCPMSVRTESEAGNQFVFTVNRLPVHVESASSRLSSIRAETTASKRVARAEAEIADSAAVVSELVPPLAWTLLGRLAGTAVGRIPPLSNLQVSNVPGVPFPLFLAGARLESMHTRTFVQPGSGLFVLCMTYNGTMNIDITALRELVPDPGRLSQAIADELTVLKELATAVATR